MAAVTTPKFKSKEFKQALAALKGVYDSHSLGITLVDALDRRAAEQIYSRFAQAGRGVRVAGVGKEQLADKITEAFFRAEDVAYPVLRELDRAAKKERSIVASIPTDQAPARVRSYRAISLKRERAKFIWALARDPRPELVALATEMITQHFAEQAQLETTKRVLAGEEEGSALEQVELAKRLKEQAEHLREAATQAKSLRDKVEELEAERAQLLVKIGRSERGLRQEVQARQSAEDQLKVALREQASSTADLEAAVEAEKKEAERSAYIEELERKLRRVSKLASASKSLSSAQEALEASEHQRKQAERAWERERQALADEQSQLQSSQAKLQDDLQQCREELHQARQRVATLEPLVPEVGPDGEAKGVAVLLDQANLAATAYSLHRRKVDFGAVLSEVRGGRQLSRALAFVVDNGGVNFGGFCDSLRKSGWELRVKKPKRFSDGTQKADWDMGIAMEAVQLIGVVETVVIVSGDGDFAPLARYLRRNGLQVEAAGYDRSLATELQNAVDRTIHLSDCLEQS